MKNTIFSAERNEFLGRWLWILFLLFIPGMIAGVMDSEAVSSAVPSLGVAGKVLNFICTAVSAMVMMILSRESECYKNAAMATVLSAAASLSLLVTEQVMGEDMTMLMTVVIVIVLLYGTNQEFMGHADVTRRNFHELSLNWEKLWKWTFGSYAVMIGGSLLIFVSVEFAVILVMLSAIAMVAVGIWKIMLLYKTAQAFRKSTGK